MKKRYLEAGQIVNTHGVAGEVKVQSWCDTPEVLADFDTLYDENRKPFRVQKSFVHKGCVIMRLEGVTTCEAAEALRGTVLYIDRESIDLPEDLVFVQDILGLPVFDRRTETTVGTLREVLPNPAHDMYVIAREGQKDALIPACAPFLVEVDLEGGQIVVETIEGLIE